MDKLLGSEDAVLRMFNPKSIAVVGASSREGALSWWPLHLVATKGFDGEIYPVNPSRDELEGMKCYPDIASIGKPIDVAVVVLNATMTPAAVAQCAEAGVKTVVLPTQGLGEMGPEGVEIQRRMVENATARGMRIVGPNTDGFANLTNGAIGSIQPLYADAMAPGPVGLVTQSGATSSSLMIRLKQEGIGCRMVVSGGNEVDLGLADYMSVMVQDPNIKIILSFVESIRKPDDFLKVADLAAELGKPIVLIKVGRSQEGARRAAAHTGALAGADALYDAMFAARGVIRVSELSELVAVAKLFLSQGAPHTAGVGIMSVSGGQAGTLADKAGEVGVPVPAISDAVEQRLTSALQFGKGFNPCDLTGEIASNPGLALQVYEGFSEEDALGTIVFARKHLTARASIEAARMLGEASHKDCNKPLAIYAMDGEIVGEEAAAYAAHNIPTFANLNDLYSACRKLADWSAFQQARKIRSREPTPARSDRSFTGVVPDAAGKAMLTDAGVRLVGEAFAATREEAIAAAGRIGFPVVLKVVSERIAHKTEAGGVKLNLADGDAVGKAFDEIMASAREYLADADADGVLVQEQVVGGVEMILGAQVDPDMGAFVVVGAGGIFTELMKDAVIRPCPVSAGEAREMIASLKSAVMLDGFRGAPKADKEAFAQTIASFSRFAAQEAGWLAEADLNPVLVMNEGQGVRVVDTLLIGRG
ncbi:acetate--CoA ligase family protein [Sphingobium sp. DEHP117]|uniref:acetate--CoA ligase family protein n=1 Tax=Sphingobium sp. DEHP117 TaxID=2993436 RepID=UPI0027D4FC8A|nr:acetate--CoA ligase family protein [Sphingobium sp. DEHP117]MDQ4421560.1 acetate--CoA ligase family protein [Sphingobium sp. DEHP117]